MDITLYRTDIQNLIIEIQANRGKDPEKTIADCDRLEAFGKETKEDALIGFARFTRGETFYLMNDMANFYHEMLTCLEPFENIKEWGYLAMANNMLGIMSLNRGNPPFAMDYYMKAMRYCREYKLPDLEWMVHMNMGNLYLHVSDFDRAREHLNVALAYIKAHPDQEDYYRSLTAIYSGLGRADLNQQEFDGAGKFLRAMETETRDHLEDSDKILVDCFGAKFYYALGKMDRCLEYVASIKENFSDRVPIMDVFDDVYEYLEVLLDLNDGEDFFPSLIRVEKLTKQTSVRFLERRMVDLRIKWYKKTDDYENYAKEAVHYYELEQLMEQENHMMINNMLSLRDSLHDLAEINREVEKKNQILKKRSESDALTGLPNRFALNEYADEVFARAYKNGTGLAVEILDIDFFKEYNDNYGHPEGDKVIRFIADTIRDMEKYPGVFTARYGGDEFVIIYEGYSDRQGFSMAKELKKNILSKKITHEYTRTKTKLVTISQGIFWSVPQADDIIWNYLHAADQQLYRVKTRSRNSIMMGRSLDRSDESVDEVVGDKVEILPTNELFNIEDRTEEDA